MRARIGLHVVLTAPRPARSQGIICQMLEDGVELDLTPGQRAVVRRVLIPELALAAARTFDR
eukprot:7114909-Prymnesium_polylepis.1